MTFLNKYRWEATHVTVIAGVIATLALATGLFGAPRGATPQAGSAPPILQKPMSSSSAATAQSVPPAQAVQASTQNGTTASQQSDPTEITVGASGISNRYRLLSVERKTGSSKSDELTVRLHVVSLAMEPLVSPFESDMLQIRSPGLQPINPSTSFRLPIPSGETRNQDIVFNIPQGLDLNRATLQIHYYNDQSEIPLSLALNESPE
jgi:hypothetical protein